MINKIKCKDCTIGIERQVLSWIIVITESDEPWIYEREHKAFKFCPDCGNKNITSEEIKMGEHVCQDSGIKFETKDNQELLQYCNELAERINTLVDSLLIISDRLEKLESMIDVEKIEKLIFHGAETHASILKCEAEYKILSKYISDCDVARFEADERLDERIKKLEGGNIQGAHNLIHTVSKDLSQRVNALEKIAHFNCGADDPNNIYRKCRKCENTTFQIRGELQSNDLIFVCNACRYLN